jgi:hypothetical protein
MSRVLSMTYLNVAAILTFLLIILFKPIALDQAHQTDTMLFTNLGWRVANGYLPVADFPHFFSGISARVVGFTFTVTEASFKGLEYAFVLIFAFTALMIWLLAWQRLNWMQTSTLIALAAALIISGQPIETEYPRMTHSFSYNHTGLALMMGLTVFGLIRAEQNWAEMMSALVAGGVIYVLIMIKSPFGIMMPFLLLACLVQARWTSAILVIVGAVLVMLALDPGMSLVLGSTEYMMGTRAAERSGGVPGLIRRGIQIILASGLPLTFTLMMAGLALAAGGRAGRTFVIAGICLGLGYGAASTTMDGLHDRRLIPFAVAFTLVALARIVNIRDLVIDPAGHWLRALALMVPLGLAYGLILPSLMSSVIGGIRSVYYAPHTLIDEGPMKAYFAPDTLTETVAALNLPTAQARLEKAVDLLITERIEKDIPLFADGEFIAYADGVALLQTIPEVEKLGVIPNARTFDFTMPLNSKVVPEFPVFPTRTRTGIRSFEAIPASVDVVMLSIFLPGLYGESLLNEQLLDLMGDNFIPCISSRIWTAYVRRADGFNFCQPNAIPRLWSTTDTNHSKI